MENSFLAGGSPRRPIMHDERVPRDRIEPYDCTVTEQNERDQVMALLERATAIVVSDSFEAAA